MKKNIFNKLLDKIIIFKNDNPVLFIYIIGNFLNTILLRLFTIGKFQLRSIFCDISFVLLIGGLSFLIKKNRRNIYFVITTIIMVIICMTNSLYYNKKTFHIL